MRHHSRISPKRAGSAQKPLVLAVSSLAAIFGFARAYSHKLTGAPIGSLCGTAKDCQSGQCLLAGPFGSCTEACESDTDCAESTRCVDSAGARYCIKQEPAGSLCQNGRQCLSGLCLGVPQLAGIQGFEGKCAAACGASEDGQCPDHQYCAAAGTELGAGFDRAALTQPACLAKKSGGLFCTENTECESDDCAAIVDVEGDANVPEFLQALRRCR